MKSKKLKIFLGGYINSTNAQNLNCLALAKYLDKSKFEIKTMSLFSGNLETPKIAGTEMIKVGKPHRVTKYVGYLKGIMWCDIAYLPKGEITGFNRLIIKILGKKSICTVEGIIDDILYCCKADVDKGLQRFKNFSKLYSITEFMRNYNFQHHHLYTEDKILYLGTETNDFLINRIKIHLKNVGLIGNDLLRKGIYDYLEVANFFPEITFHIAGSGNGKVDVEKEIEKRGLENIKFHGSINRIQMIEFLKGIDLHFFPSRSEGFPKVTLETASAGVPSMVYPDYGAEEWITDNENGFIVKDKEEAVLKIKELILNPDQLKKVSKNAVELGKSFDWKIKIKDWEREFLKLAYN